MLICIHDRSFRKIKLKLKDAWPLGQYSIDMDSIWASSELEWVTTGQLVQAQAVFELPNHEDDHWSVDRTGLADRSFTITGLFEEMKKYFHLMNLKA